MDKETLRKQIYDELHSQFESKLRDARKQKSQIEEELESSSEKWRAERRRLNSEIDRLESAIADARVDRRKAAAAKPSIGVETPDVPKHPVAEDEQLKKAAREWESERARLEGEISRLQAGLAEMLERANNPLRSGQAAREQLEMRLEEALKMKRQAEDALLQAREEWQKEKLKLAREMIRLRRSVGGSAGPKILWPEEEAELAETKNAHQDALRLNESQVEELQAEVQHLKRQLEETKDRVSAEVVAQLRRQYDEHVQEVIRQKTELSGQLNNASALLEAERSRFATASAQSKSAPPSEISAAMTIDTAAIDAEVARTEAQLAEIVKLIDDPSTELSFVIRKNVERAGLDAYLKGILFSLGRNQGM